MGNTTLRTAFRGLQKEAVLRQLDTLNMLLLALESGSIGKDAAIAEAKQIFETPIKKQFNGFAEEDVHACLQSLYNAILECMPEES